MLDLDEARAVEEFRLRILGQPFQKRSELGFRKTRHVAELLGLDRIEVDTRGHPGVEREDNSRLTDTEAPAERPD